MDKQWVDLTNIYTKRRKANRKDKIAYNFTLLSRTEKSIEIKR